MDVVARILVSLELIPKVFIVVEAGIEYAFASYWVLDALAQRDGARLLNAKVDIRCLLWLLVVWVNDG